MADDIYFSWLLHFRDSPEYRLWSGYGDLEYEGLLYTGAGNVMNIGALEQSEDTPDARSQVSLNLGTLTAEERKVFFQDHGPIKIELNLIFTRDNGDTWRRVPRKFLGRLSKPRFYNGVYTVEIEATNGDVDRGIVKLWSDGAQQSEFPGDKGLEFKKTISEGFETNFPYGRARNPAISA